MENIESILDALNDYDKQKTPEIPKPLEEYINHLAKTGETLFPWLKIRGVLRHKLELVIANFKEVCPTENLPPCPNVEPFHFETMRDKILEQFDSFTCAPFTIQRLCELLCAPRKHYKRTDKFMRGIEKNLLVVSTVDPEQRKRSESVSSSQTLVNGVFDVSVGSSRPVATFGSKNDSRPVTVALDAASASDDTEDEDKPSAKHPTSNIVPDTDHQEPSEAKETTNGAADANEEIEPSSKTETLSSGPAETPVATVTMTREESPTVQMSEDVIVPVVAPIESDKVEKALAASTEEECAKSVDVESVASEEKPVEMEEEKLVADVEPGAKEEDERIADEPLEEPQESGKTIDAEVKHPLPPSESTETPVSDKKRPLEKAEDGDDDDDREHSPDAKQPRIFSPDKVIEETPLPEQKNEPDNHVDEEQVAVTKSEETAEKAPETDPTLPKMESQ
ncbi:serine/threonine-protein phosphatase 4 regulatory subunit 2-like isoform X2 [Daphnia carinata]|uniref:serine/threonine-protein phosphatase 4 regulatory subunit 2-like isoform X2 n=1 Tax=Daphnia carinata TaxID=120202 RepID=UPI002579833A|nr:serine/threonine-protein phosphatase 4 regulatory subunit 2-like isoform X2 [Daphnia carinata]